jgi:hypothetical protein
MIKITLRGSQFFKQPERVPVGLRLQFQTEDSPVFHPECKLTICLVFDILIVS